MEYKSTGIRVEGTPEQLDEALQRLKTVFHLKGGKRYESIQNPELFYTYLRAYIYEPNTLLNRAQASEAEVQRLAEVIGELERENQRLKEQLGLVPTPRPGDVVLGSKHR